MQFLPHQLLLLCWIYLNERAKDNSLWIQQIYAYCITLCNVKYAKIALFDGKNEYLQGEVAFGWEPFFAVSATGAFSGTVEVLRQVRRSFISAAALFR